jgi:DNA-binding response OmpR family regulator
MAATRLPIIRLPGGNTFCDDLVHLGDLTLQLFDDICTVLADGYPPLKLTPSEYACFCMLLAHPCVLVSNRRLRRSLERTLLGTDIEFHMDNIRRKLRQSGFEIHILRVRSQGYLLFTALLDEEETDLSDAI